MSVQGLAAYGVLGEQQLLGQRCDQLAAHELSQSAPAAEASTGLAGAGASAGAASSNYDFVKIKVRLGTHLEHYYILSRFLLSRMLTVITLPQHKVGGHLCKRRCCSCWLLRPVDEQDGCWAPFWSIVQQHENTHTFAHCKLPAICACSMGVAPAAGFPARMRAPACCARLPAGCARGAGCEEAAG